MEAAFSDLIGRTVLSIEGASQHSEQVRIVTDAGAFVLLHQQDCCEHVSVADVTGDPADLVGAVVRLAEVSTDSGDTAGGYGSQTWTFYRLRTDKGDLDIRWFGESNGYYSEAVDVYREVPDVGWTNSWPDEPSGRELARDAREQRWLERRRNGDDR